MNKSAEEIGVILTDCGLEVESIEPYQSVKGGLEGIVIGEVKTRVQHPNADRLSLTTVDVGIGGDLQIVCGASNVAAGQKVVVATVGAMLFPTFGEPFQISKSKIRGETSEGMICAEDEIGLGESHVGIMVLEPTARVGTPASDYFKIEKDYVFEIGLTPNRVDASCHIGVARDLIAALNVAAEGAYKLAMPSVEAFKENISQSPIQVVVEAGDACPRYSGVCISGIRVKPSPDWLQNRLKAIGLRPINNVVDVTNFVLHETGQPLHAFDKAAIKGDKVIVKKLQAGTKFVTLDETERTLLADDLMICNAEAGMCIAGVFGGLHSGVNEKTKAIFLESAYFDPGHVRKTAKAHNLKTDSAFRFERGTDPNATIYALKRAALLIQELAGGEISSSITDVYPKAISPFKMELTYKNTQRLIGAAIEPAVIKNILLSLGIDIVSESATGLSLEVPTNKVDVQREVDVIEEILRVYGYNNIALPGRILASLPNAPKPDKEKLQNRVSDYLTDNGFHEMMALSLTKSAYYEKLESLKAEHNVPMLNPLSQELNVLRQSMLFGGLEAIAYNRNRRQADLKLYEFGKTYHKYRSGYTENQHLMLFATGRKESEQWNAGKEAVDFYHLKGFVENVLAKLGFSRELYSINGSVTSDELLGEALNIRINKKDVAIIGKVKKQFLKSFDIGHDVYCADLRWDLLMSLLKQEDIVYREVSKFPEVRRDLSMLVEKKTQFAEIEQIAYQSEKQLLKAVNLFDVYEGDKIEAGKKSYAVSFTLLDEAETLTDKRVDKTMEKIMQNLEKNLGAQIRK